MSCVHAGAQSAYLNRSSYIFLYPDATAISGYGGGSGPIHYDHVVCTGDETHLVDCNVLELGFCSHSDDAGVSCFSGE